jgi:short-subunit dehydrogenase
MTSPACHSSCQVNFFAVVNVTKTMLPLIKKSRGRIVNITSMAGLFIGGPSMSAYSASKHAAEAFTTSLRFELAGWGCKVGRTLATLCMEY